MKLSIIVPCYNEEKGVESLIEQLDLFERAIKDKYEYELIFIDDGSIDDTYYLLAKHYDNKNNAVILRHVRNKNLGGALRTGFDYASGDFIATLDSDLTYSPFIIIRMLELIKDYDLVTASPYHKKGAVLGVPYYRVFLSKTVSKIYKVLLKSKINTYTAMVRLYRKELIKNISFKSNDFLSVTEIIINAIIKGYRVAEIPAKLKARKFGKSKAKTFNLIFKHIRLMAGLKWT